MENWKKIKKKLKRKTLKKMKNEKNDKKKLNGTPHSYPLLRRLRMFLSRPSDRLQDEVYGSVGNVRQQHPED